MQFLHKTIFVTSISVLVSCSSTKLNLNKNNTLSIKTKSSNKIKNMNQNLITKKAIKISATSNQVWNTLTNKELIKEYLYGAETTTDWNKDSEIIFQGEYNGHKYRDHGKILENILYKKISYSYWTGFSGLEDKPENYATVTYEIKPLNSEEVEFSWTQQGFSSEDNYNHSQKATEELVKHIKEIAERK